MTDKNHPIRVILESAAFLGNQPTKSELDDLEAFELPDGQTLGRFRATVKRAAAEIVAAKADGYKPARDISDREFDLIAARMTPEESALKGDANPESLDAITSRMFGN